MALPPRRALVALLALAVLPPWLARVSSYPVGDFAMFNTIERYHLDLSVNLPDHPAEAQPVDVRSLTPHLSRDARAVILPAASNGFGKDQTDLLQSGLPDLARLLCALYPAATSANARLGRGPLPSQGSHQRSTELPLTWTYVTLPCAESEQR